MVLKNAIEETTVKAVGGVITYGSSYAIVHTALTVKDASEIATLIATCMTALYFCVQFLYTSWKWRADFKNNKKENSMIKLHKNRRR